PPPAATGDSAVSPPPAATAAEPARAPSESTSASSSPSALAIENNLFAAAMRAKQAGRPAEAIRLLSRLLGEHPSSPLAESALASRHCAVAAGSCFACVTDAHCTATGFGRCDAVWHRCVPCEIDAD